MTFEEFFQKDRRSKIIAKAKAVIASYGTLRYCKATICGCMGCCNRTMTEEEYHEALSIPEIQALIPMESKKTFNAEALLAHIKERRGK